ncbi:hypothetical protein FA95DRAFT_1605912 [Auriscalpium vulgare]|uniref:Uncharacterized protein n=1 Tax=Auriscalpium vulgare TaxID=40419 RepID=A0ACB8RVN1_9AGAM|nr:hypothetical protein FA95DRAFT_1605912 [Auriscalpium vulgare]
MLKLYASSTPLTRPLTTALRLAATLFFPRTTFRGVSVSAPLPGACHTTLAFLAHDVLRSVLRYRVHIAMKGEQPALCVELPSPISVRLAGRLLHSPSHRRGHGRARAAGILQSITTPTPVHPRELGPGKIQEDPNTPPTRYTLPSTRESSAQTIVESPTTLNTRADVRADRMRTIEAAHAPGKLSQRDPSGGGRAQAPLLTQMRSMLAAEEEPLVSPSRSHHARPEDEGITNTNHLSSAKMKTWIKPQRARLQLPPLRARLHREA